MSALAVALALCMLAEGSALAAERPSFDCGKATTPSERAICADEALAGLDRDIAALYRRRRAQSPIPRAVDAAQKQWLAVRDVCQENVACLAKEHAARKQALEEALARFAKAPAKDVSGFSGVYDNEVGTVEIEAVSTTEFDVTITTADRNARWTCDVSATGQLKNGAIVIAYRPETEGYKPRTVTLRRKDGRLTVSDAGEDHPDFCGHNGTIEGTYRRKG